MKLGAVLPAGGGVGARYARETGVSERALLRFGGETVLGRTIRVLRETGRVGAIVVVGPAQVRDHEAARGADGALPEGASYSESVLRGMQWLREKSNDHPAKILIVATDLPFLTAEGVSGFVSRCPAEAEICVPVVRRSEFEKRFPGAPTKFFRFADGLCAVGCASLVDPDALERNRAHIERALSSRKNPLAMAAMLGLPFILRFITRSLRVAEVEERGRHLLRCTGMAIWDVAPELACDIDRVQDYRYAMARFAEREEGRRASDSR